MGDRARLESWRTQDRRFRLLALPMVFREMPEKTSSGASLLPHIPPYDMAPDPQLLPSP